VRSEIGERPPDAGQRSIGAICIVESGQGPFDAAVKGVTFAG
jgi:hypothetical protein